MDQVNNIYRIEQGFQFQGNDWWKWWVWIEASDADLDNIEHVVYTLHSTFVNPVRTIANRASKFILKTEGWGTFPIYATLYLKDGTRISLEHELFLNYSNLYTTSKDPTPGNSAQIKLEIINKAREVIRGAANLNIDELKKLTRELERLDQFAYATEIHLRTIERKKHEGQPIPLKDYQTLAKYIYKDHSLPSSFKFEKALLELKVHGDLLTTTNCETLGLSGAIYKRIWKFDHQFRNLVLSRFFYEKGFIQWKTYIKQKLANESFSNDSNDDGYNAINFAYISDLMAVDKLGEYSTTMGLTKEIISNLNEAKETREYILKEFMENMNSNEPRFKEPVIAKLENQPWIIATVAEAYFGLYKYEQALQFSAQYIGLPGLNQWEIRTFNQQLFSLAYLQLYVKNFHAKTVEDKITGFEQLELMAKATEVKRMNACLNIFLNRSEISDAKVEIKKEGKVGLALSGGGFRASLFHIGVLASLAEYDELKNVDVISCVSGGSIIGAYYYLKVKKLLESKTDRDIQREDYIQIVKETETHFLEAVQKNLRMKIFTNLFLNFKMLVDRNYSRSHRIGELYEKYFYQPLAGTSPIYMNDLYINPKLEDGETFSFDTDNWKREHKIPQLVLNATSVNTGHNWQFTASWMGEPPGNIQADIDVKPRLRRMYYKEAPGAYKNFRLGYAVGASACVPFMFHPMPLLDLYPGINLQLIDGGLHDNQGIAALIEAECNNMIISDASGQLPTNSSATENDAAVFWRADNILQERIRELQFMDIKERDYTTQLDSLIKLHLKNGLGAYPKNWKDCIDPPRKIYDGEINMDMDLLKFGILHDTQDLISNIRTDLDSFNDIEATALMYSGYAQTDYELHEKGKKKKGKFEWNFLKITDYVKFPEKAEKIQKILYTGRMLPFKVLEISKPLKITYNILRVFAAIAVIALIVMLATGRIPINNCIPVFAINVTWKRIMYIAGVLILWCLVKWVLKRFKMSNKLINNPLLLFLMILLFVLFNLYILLFNGIYNRAGSLKSLS